VDQLELDRQVRDVLEKVTYKAAAGSTIALEVIEVIERLRRELADSRAENRRLRRELDRGRD
jgi:hypothetical protein